MCIIWRKKKRNFQHFINDLEWHCLINFVVTEEIQLKNKK